VVWSTTQAWQRYVQLTSGKDPDGIALLAARAYEKPDDDQHDAPQELAAEQCEDPGDDQDYRDNPENEIHDVRYPDGGAWKLEPVGGSRFVAQDHGHANGGTNTGGGTRAGT